MLLLLFYINKKHPKWIPYPQNENNKIERFR